MKLRLWLWKMLGLGAIRQDLLDIHNQLITVIQQVAEFRKDVNAVRIAQVKEAHRQAASAEPETLGKPYGLTKEQAEQVDWSRVR